MLWMHTVVRQKKMLQSDYIFRDNGSYQWRSKPFESPEANRTTNIQHTNYTHAYLRLWNLYKKGGR